MRLAGQVKMGYYPTPENVTEHIRSLLRFPEDAISLIDPCAGEGLALAGLAQGQRAATYGVEPDGERYTEATGHLTHVLHCGMEEMVTTRDAGSLLLLNPPYDYDDGKRVEERFLQKTYNLLRRGGVLVFIIPQPRLTQGIAKMLAYRFNKIRVLRFPEDDYAIYKQIVILAERGGPASDAERRAQEARLSLIARQEASDLTDTDAAAGALEPYAVPASGEIRTFRSRLLTPESALELARASTLWSRIETRIRPGEEGQIGRPPLPLHTGHLGLLIASGLLNGVVGEGDNRHVVAGRQIKHREEETETDMDESGRETDITRIRESFRVSVKVLLQSGDIKVLV